MLTKDPFKCCLKFANLCIYLHTHIHTQAHTHKHMHTHNTLSKTKVSAMLIFSNPMATILFPLTRTQWYLPMACFQSLSSSCRLYTDPRLLSKTLILLTLEIRAMLRHLHCLANKVNIPNPAHHLLDPNLSLQASLLLLSHRNRKPTGHNSLGLLTTSSICLSIKQSRATHFSLPMSCFSQTLSVSLSFCLPGWFSGENIPIHCVFFLLNLGMEKQVIQIIPWCPVVVRTGQGRCQLQDVKRQDTLLFHDIIIHSDYVQG